MIIIFFTSMVLIAAMRHSYLKMEPFEAGRHVAPKIAMHLVASCQTVGSARLWYSDVSDSSEESSSSLSLSSRSSDAHAASHTPVHRKPAGADPSVLLRAKRPMSQR